MLVALVSLVGSPAFAVSTSLMIDDFSVVQEIAQSGPGAHSNTNTVLSGALLGGSRKLSLDSNIFAIDSVNSRIMAGVANYESGPLSSGMQKYEYNGNGLGLGNLLAGVSMFSLDLTTFNAGTFAPTIISLIANDGADHLIGSHSLNDLSTAPQTLNFDPSASGVNFNSLAWLRLEFDSTTAKGADFTVSDFRATVPEPLLVNVAWMLALGGVGLLRARRK